MCPQRNSLFLPARLCAKAMRPSLRPAALLLVFVLLTSLALVTIYTTNSLDLRGQIVGSPAGCPLATSARIIIDSTSETGTVYTHTGAPGTIRFEIYSPPGSQDSAFIPYTWANWTDDSKARLHGGAVLGVLNNPLLWMAGMPSTPPGGERVANATISFPNFFHDPPHPPGRKQVADMARGNAQTLDLKTGDKVTFIVNAIRKMTGQGSFATNVGQIELLVCDAATQPPPPQPWSGCSMPWQCGKVESGGVCAPFKIKKCVMGAPITGQVCGPPSCESNCVVCPEDLVGSGGLCGCGDGIITAPEQCDNGLSNGNDGLCTINCTNIICGDGKVQGSERCDDGNTVDGDGCNAVCKIEPGWECANTPNVNPDCSESDGGLNPKDGGKVTFAGQDYADSCVSDPKKVSEYFCSEYGPGVDAMEIDCPEGTTCSGGSCVGNGSPGTCGDSDGFDLTVASISGGRQIEECVPGKPDMISEYYCVGSEVWVATVRCPGGALCENGTCSGNASSGTMNPQTACSPVCGNKIVTPPEQCDDGNIISGDTCEADCTNPIIGPTCPLPAQCGDGKDNDNDGLTDAKDAGCHSDGDATNPSTYMASDDDEKNGTPLCSDGSDNDADGKIDAADPACHTDGNAGNASTYNPLGSTEDQASNSCANNSFFLSKSTTCTSSGQLCSPDAAFQITTPIATPLMLTASVPTGREGIGQHCAWIRLHVFVDGQEVAVTPFMGWLGGPGPLSVGPIFLKNVTAGTHQIAFQGESKMGDGGCNPGSLASWGLLARVTTSVDQCNSAAQNCGDGADNDGDGKTDTQDQDCHSDGIPSNAASYFAGMSEAAASSSSSVSSVVSGACTTQNATLKFTEILHPNDPQWAGSTATQFHSLPAGTYLIEYKSGAWSPWADLTKDTTFLGGGPGKTWLGYFQAVTLPPSGPVQNDVVGIQGFYSTAAQASSAAMGKTLLRDLGNVPNNLGLYLPDSTPSGINHGSVTAAVYQCPRAATACSNGRDDDGDQKVDAADPECHSDRNPSNGSSYDVNDSSESN